MWVVGGKEKKFWNEENGRDMESRSLKSDPFEITGASWRRRPGVTAEGMM